MKASERVEVEALRSLFDVPEPRGLLREAGGAIAIRVDGLPIKELNRIAGLYDVDDLAELEDLFDDRPYWITLDPEANLDDELAARGYVPAGAWQKFARGVGPYAGHTDLDVGDARSRHDVATYLRRAWTIPALEADWLSGVFGHPDWHCFVAYDGAQAVGGGMLYVLDDVGWIGVAATQPEYRGRGVQSAVFAARFDRARELGLRQLVTETGITKPPGPSYRNMLRAGFEPTYARPVYTASDAGSSSSSGSRP
jgi:GNAT superfamily N-acetyltransferase